MEYISLIILLLLLIFHYDYREHLIGRKWWYVGVMIYCILLAGLRYRVGNDTVNYATYYYDIFPNLYDYWFFDFSNEKFGRGYLFFNAIARTISDDFVVMQMLLAIFVNSIIFYFIYNNTKNIFTGILLYFIFFFLDFNTEVLREACAVAVFLLGWKSFYNHKWIRYYIYCGIAILFHPSASFTLLLPFFTSKYLSKGFKISWTTVIITLSLFLLGTIITSKFFDIIRLLGMATMDNYADIYENSRFSGAKMFSITGLVVVLTVNVIYPFIMGWIKFNGNGKDEESQYTHSLKVMFVTYIYLASISNSLIILGRFNNYLGLFMVLVYSDAIFQTIKIFRKKLRFSFSLWSIYLFPLLFLRVLILFQPSSISKVAPIQKYYPYYSYLYKGESREREIYFYYSFGAGRR